VPCALLSLCASTVCSAPKQSQPQRHVWSDNPAAARRSTTKTVCDGCPSPSGSAYRGRESSQVRGLPREMVDPFGVLAVLPPGPGFGNVFMNSVTNLRSWPVTRSGRLRLEIRMSPEAGERAYAAGCWWAIVQGDAVAADAVEGDRLFPAGQVQSLHHGGVPCDELKLVFTAFPVRLSLPTRQPALEASGKPRSPVPEDCSSPRRC